MLKTVIILFSVLTALTLTGCTTGKPATVEPVSPFNIHQYLGTWYEIARLDHPFERNLENVTAHYQLNTDGTVKVINRGFNTLTQQWKEAEGKAKFVENADTGYLKVSFFGPFYGSYLIFHLEPDYSVALISSYNYDYLWLLSRTRTLSATQLEHYKNLATQAGFNTDKFIYPKQ